MHRLPVDSAGTLIRLDVHLVMVNVNLRNVHLKVVGQKLDWFAHCANARPARCLEHLLQGRQVGTCSYEDKETSEDGSGNLLTAVIRESTGLSDPDPGSRGLSPVSQPSRGLPSTSSDIPRLLNFIKYTCSEFLSHEGNGPNLVASLQTLPSLYTRLRPPISRSRLSSRAECSALG